MKNYANAKMNEIFNLVDDYCYIGATCSKSLCKVICVHRDLARNSNTRSALHEHMRNIDIGNFKFRLFENFPCKNGNELQGRLNFYLAEQRPKLNSKNENVDIVYDCPCSGTYTYVNRCSHKKMHRIYEKSKIIETN